MPVPSKTGDMFHPPGFEPYVTCGICALYEGVPRPSFLPEILAAFPMPDAFEKGKDVSPYPYQSDDALQVAGMRSVLINSEMGTGKTPTFLLSINAELGTVLFVPSSVKWNWAREGVRWRPDLRFKIAKTKKTWRIPGPGEVLISSYGMLPGDPCKECKKTNRRACTHVADQDNPLPEIDRPIIMVGDEIQYVQNKSQRRRKWDLLKERVWAAGGFLRGLTGTAVSNSPQDLYEILQCLNLERRAFDSEDVFKKIFYEWFEREKGMRSLPTGYARDMLLKRLRPVRICRLRRHVLSHLPPVQTRPPIKVELNKQTMAEVNECVQRLLATRRAWQDVREGLIECPWGHYKAGKRTRQKLGKQEKERRQSLFDDRVRFYFETEPWEKDSELKLAVKECLESRHETPAIGELSKIRAMLALAKVSVAREIVELHEGRGEPLIVFCQHVSILEKLFEGREGWGIYTGKVTQKKRDTLWQAFQKGEVKHGLGVSIMAGAEGINLTRAAHMLFIDEFWNPAKNCQARDRLNRPGAEIHDSITVMRLEANHAVDRLVRLTLKEKLALAEAIEDEEHSQKGLVA